MAEIRLYVGDEPAQWYESDVAPRIGEKMVLNVFDNQFDRVKRIYNVVDVEHCLEDSFGELSIWIAVTLEEPE